MFSKHHFHNFGNEMGGGIKGTDIGLSKQASIFICPINKQKDIISMNNVQGQAARKAHKAQHCWPPCKKERKI